AVIALCACVLVTVAVLLYPAKYDASFAAVVLYAVGLAMLWSFSLRGASVYGFDISDEYYIFQHTVASGVWHPARPTKAYGALLSPTVLPPELHVWPAYRTCWFPSSSILRSARFSLWRLS